MSQSVIKEISLPHPPEEVWKAIASAKALEEWMYPNNFEPLVGHRFTFKVPPKPEVKFEGLTVQCEVLTCNPPRELSFTWVAMEINTRVDYRLEPEGDGTRLYFEHSGFEQPQAFHGAVYGWDMMFGRLAVLLDGGRRS